MKTHDENADQRGYIIFIITLATTKNNRDFIHIIITFLLYNARGNLLYAEILYHILNEISLTAYSLLYIKSSIH